MFRLKRSKADKVFSDYIREKADYTCERCFTEYEKPTQALHCSHFWGRKNKSTRFEVLNAAALCYGCHQFFTSNPQEHREWFKRRLGEAKYDLLEAQAKTPKKVDEKLIVFVFTELLKNLKNGNVLK